MRRTAAVALRSSQRGHLLGGNSFPSPIILSSRPLSTSADDLLQLFKQAAANKSTSREAAPSSSSSHATPKPAAAGRAKASSSHWAKKLATQLESSAPQAPQDTKAGRTPGTIDIKHRRQSLYSPVGAAAPLPTEVGRLFAKEKKRPRAYMRDAPSSLAEDTQFQDDDFDDEDFRRPSLREGKDDTDAEVSFSSTLDEGGDDDWEAMAAEMNAWGAKLHKTLQPHLEVINKHVRTKKARRQKYAMFLERVLARRQAKKKPETKGAEQWQWPKERDYLYNTDLFIPLNLQLKGIEEEGEDLHGLLTQQMEEAARAIGHNPSWPLEEKRKLMLGLKKFYEQAVRSGPGQHDIFADHRHAMDDDYANE